LPLKKEAEKLFKYYSVAFKILINIIMFNVTLYLKNLSSNKEDKTSAIEKDYINGKLLMSLDEGLFESQSANCILQIKKISNDEVIIETLKTPRDTHLLKINQEIEIENNDGDAFQIKVISIQSNGIAD